MVGPNDGVTALRRSAAVQTGIGFHLIAIIAALALLNKAVAAA